MHVIHKYINNFHIELGMYRICFVVSYKYTESLNYKVKMVKKKLIQNYKKKYFT